MDPYKPDAHSYTVDPYEPDAHSYIVDHYQPDAHSHIVDPYEPEPHSQSLVDSLACTAIYWEYTDFFKKTSWPQI